MAEVRKKVVEDKYNTKSIKKVEKKKVEKKASKESHSEKKDNKKGAWANFRIFCNGVKGEFNKVHWPSKENMLKYSIATIFFIIFCGAFFYLIDVIFALIRSLF